MGHGDNALPEKNDYHTWQGQGANSGSSSSSSAAFGSGGEFVCLEWSTWNMDKAKDICMPGLIPLLN